MINATLLAVVCFFPIRASVRRGVKAMSLRYFRETSPPAALKHLRTFATDAAIFVALVLAYWAALDVHDSVLVTISYVVFASTLVVQGFIDVFTQYLPRLYSWLGVLVCGGLITLHALVDWNFDAWIRGVIAMAGLTLAMLVIGVVSRGGIGGGDVYLAPLLGLMLGFKSYDAVIGGTFVGFVLGALFAITLLAKGKGRKHRFAFGPFLVIGAIWALTL